MIDFIHIKVPFKSEFLLVEKDDHAFLNEKVLDELAVCTNVRKDEDGDITNVSVPWHSVQSGQSSVAFKISLPRIKGFPNIEFKASPAKVKAGGLRDVIMLSHGKGFPLTSKSRPDLTDLDPCQH